MPSDCSTTHNLFHMQLELAKAARNHSKHGCMFPREWLFANYQTSSREFIYVLLQTSVIVAEEKFKGVRCRLPYMEKTGGDIGQQGGAWQPCSR